MLLDSGNYASTGFDQDRGDNIRRSGSVVASCRWTVVVPFHNERDFLGITLRSLAIQTMPFRLILVDNGSTDGSADIAASLCRELCLDADFLTEMRPGKVSALQKGLAATRTELVATCDADTRYPFYYLERAAALLDDEDVVAAVACTNAPGASALQKRLSGWRMKLTASILPQQCHNGGAGQVFRTFALKACGGFDPRLWNWVLEDHEIMARIELFGRIAYHRAFRCEPSVRPRKASTTGWSFAEQLRYHASNSSTRRAFFQSYLGPRLRQRALTSDRLRREEKYKEESLGLVGLHPVRG